MERENMFMNESNNSLFPFPMQNEQHGTSEQLQNYFFNPNWDNSMDQNDTFESALSSMVSSPVTSNAPAASCENIVLRELIGRLGSICHSAQVSPHSYMHGNNSTTNSCYSTPMNSPPKLNLTMMDHQMRANLGDLLFPGSLAPIVPEPGFAERAARYSCFGNNGRNGESPVEVSGYQRMVVEEYKNVSLSLQEDKSSLSDHNDGNSRKRKSVSKGKGKDVHSSISIKEDNDAAEKNELSAKRSKTEDNEKGKDGTENGNKKENKDDQKDYIHVRARRGQATDAHSLAERVRREKISQKMKFLQDLVPGCNKVTGKAVMLDEIINYVQSLQGQVEFLSMKLATINPGMEVNIEALLSSKDMLHSRASLPNGPFPSHNSASAYPFQSQQVPSLHAAIPNVSEMPLLPSLIDSAMGRSRSMQEPLGNYSEVTTQASSVWEDDLQSVVFGQNQTHNFYGLIATGPQMKVEK
ncbi:hypothetical protein Leryth_009673 [Lithospermum erythrorhizon]|nr:hypothetical protein Leryth_009673 [Lithospermum erythrorhizon]